jgi:hypothetical protein
MWMLIAIIVLLWTTQRHKAQPLVSLAGQTGGRASPPQTALLGGQNFDGNTWDNGTTDSVFNPQWTGDPPPPGNLIYATQGGEDGQNPANTVVIPSGSQITMTPRFAILGGGDPSLPAQVPVQVSSLNNVVRR